MNPIEAKKQEVRQNIIRFNRAHDKIAHRRNLSPDERRTMIYEGYNALKQQHARLTGELREVKAQYRQQLESAIFRPDRPSNYSGLGQRPFEVMAQRDAKARARAAGDAEELADMLEDALAIGDSYMAHSCFVEANKRAPSDTTLAAIASPESVQEGPHVQIMRRYLETDQTRQAQYVEWSLLGGTGKDGNEEVADDVLESMEMMFPREPQEIRGWRPPPPEEQGNPFEDVPEPPTVDADALTQGVAMTGGGE